VGKLVREDDSMETTMACMERVFEYTAFGSSKDLTVMRALYEGTNSFGGTCWCLIPGTQWR
jgi:hypothetical protein